MLTYSPSIAYSGTIPQEVGYAKIALVYYGPLAQLVERVIRIDEVSGSTPLGSTKQIPRCACKTTTV